MTNNSVDIKAKNAALMNYEFRNNISRVQSFPTHIGVAVNKACNVDCIFCVSGAKTTEKVEWKHFQKLEGLFSHVGNVVFSGEEVILHPDIWKMFELLSQKQVSTSFMTNGKALNENVMKSLVDLKVAQITCSFHGATPGTYESIVRGADFAQNINQFKFLKHYRVEKAKASGDLPDPKLHFHYVMLRRNIEELPAFLEIAAHLGAEVLVSKFMMIYPHLKHLTPESLYFYPKLTNDVLEHCRSKAANLPISFIAPKPFNRSKGEPYSKYFQESEIEKKYPLCAWPWRQCNISTQGHVQPCCGGLPPMGNIYETPFEEIWNCEKYRDLRATVNTPNRWPECKKCHDVAGAVSSDDIRRHLLYLGTDVRDNDLEHIKPEEIGAEGIFTSDERIYGIFVDILEKLHKGNLSIQSELGTLFDSISQPKRDYLLHRMNDLKGLNHFPPREERFLLLAIRFLNHFDHAYIAYRIICTKGNDKSPDSHTRSSLYQQWIEIEKTLSEFAVGYYNAALDSFSQSLPVIKKWFGEEPVTAVVGKLMDHRWKQSAEKIDQALESNFSRLLSKGDFQSGLH